MTDPRNDNPLSLEGADMSAHDKLNYIMDLTLELQQMASRAGYGEIATLLLQAYQRGDALKNSPPSVDERVG
ncbi:MAG: hypothetical protein AAFV69_04745 [Pseudomonadota bacterium]